FDAMPASVFEKQRQVEGICRQVIVLDHSSARMETAQ
ncbi:MAG: peptidase C39, partial [Acinetobacter johnsonii]